MPKACLPPNHHIHGRRGNRGPILRGSRLISSNELSLLETELSELSLLLLASPAPGQGKGKGIPGIGRSGGSIGKGTVGGAGSELLPWLTILLLLLSGSCLLLLLLLLLRLLCRRSLAASARLASTHPPSLHHWHHRAGFGQVPPPCRQWYVLLHWHAIISSAGEAAGACAAVSGISATWSSAIYD